MDQNTKTIAEAKAQCLNKKDSKQKYVVVEQWLKMFKKWFSPSGKEYTATLPAVEIYSYIAGFNEQGQECYANQKTLSTVGMVSDRQVRNIINMFIDMGVLSVEARDGQTSLYKALPFTDAHITPPEEVKASVNVERAAPEYQETLEATHSIEQETQESEITEQSDLFTWLISIDSQKPMQEETENFIKRALASKRIILEDDAFNALMIDLRKESEIYDSISF
ncbi:TPA: helix-turn-helix domain-containing protein [Escherichia coli]|nr:helix-turn-helix domain-containing protein [Escherichia coli]